MNETKTGYQKVIAELTEGTRELSRRSLQEFSDITPDALEALLQVWPRVKLDRKRNLLDGLQSLSETDTLVSFDILPAPCLPTLMRKYGCAPFGCWMSVMT